MNRPDSDPDALPAELLERGLARLFEGSRERVAAAITELEANPPSVHLRAEPGEADEPRVSGSEQERSAGRDGLTLGPVLGRGGMGIVYAAHDEHLGRDLALKALAPEHSERPEVLRRFLIEAQVAGQLQHPGIVPVYELGRLEDHRPWFTMKRVGGRTFADLLGSRTRPDEDRSRHLSILESVCQAVAYAHARGVVHRDLKPSNVMVGTFGEVQILDWGLALVLDGAASEASTGTVVGTPAYMAPEQARGLAAETDERTDVFALGAILCEILTGTAPYGGDTRSALAHAAAGQLDNALERLAASEADKELVSICRSCLQVDRDRRPAGAAEVAQALHAYSTGLEERARAAEIAAVKEHVRGREERIRTRVVAACVVALVVAAAGFWGWRASERHNRFTRNAGVVHEAMRRGTELSAAARHDGGAAEWGAALASLQTGAGVLSGGEVDPSLAQDFRALETEIRAGVAAAQESEGRVARTAFFVARVESIRVPEGGTAYPTDWARVGEDYASAFREAGIEFDEPLDDAELLSLGSSAVVSAALDEWAFAAASSGDENRARDLRERLSTSTRTWTVPRCAARSWRTTSKLCARGPCGRTSRNCPRGPSSCSATRWGSRATTRLQSRCWTVPAAPPRRTSPFA